ncbi:hypothetical protein JG687_00002448 [Phytophthora cactorum]|uniref:Uncharacterized protein n=1 Tax=Phytophthora cactorum TaxID=29920 RepID=A0A8T1UY98_9STRA|nr:hypothetical protein JG687_00002448 [Phytophthora cactorum]
MEPKSLSKTESINSCKDRKLALSSMPGRCTHFIVIIAWTPKDKFLLCFSTLEDESDMRSDSIIDLLDDVLDTYAIDIS